MWGALNIFGKKKQEVAETQSADDPLLSRLSLRRQTKRPKPRSLSMRRARGMEMIWVWAAKLKLASWRAREAR